MSSDRNFMQYRGFGYLHARLLLALQHDIECLEHELDELDQQDADGNEDRLASKTIDDIEVRKEEGVEGYSRVGRSRPAILTDLKHQLLEYGMAVR